MNGGEKNYHGYRPIPKKITLLGDKTKAQKYIGEADSQLSILENQMSFQKLHIGSRRVRLSSDIFVEVRKCYNAKEVIIRAGIGGNRGKRKGVRCFCNCTFSVGKVVRKYLFSEVKFPEGKTRPIIESIPGYNWDDIYLYDVECCTSKLHYTLYSFLLPTDFCDYPLETVVIVAAYNEMDFSKCQHNTATGSDTQGCHPSVGLETQNLQDESYHFFDGYRTRRFLELWRPTYRILPLCGMGMKKWINYEMR